MPPASKHSLIASRAVLTTVEHAIAVGDWRESGRVRLASLIRGLRVAILIENAVLAETLSAQLATNGLEAIANRNWVIPAGHATVVLSRLAPSMNL